MIRNPVQAISPTRVAYVRGRRPSAGASDRAAAISAAMSASEKMKARLHERDEPSRPRGGTSVPGSRGAR